MLQGQVVEEEAEFAFKRSIDAAMCGVFPPADNLLS